MNLNDETMPPSLVSLNVSLSGNSPPFVESNVRRNLYTSPKNSVRPSVGLFAHSTAELQSKRVVVIDENSNEMFDNFSMDDSRSLEDSGEKSSGDSGESDIESNANSFWSPSKSLNGGGQGKSALPLPFSPTPSGKGKGKRNLSISIPKTPPSERMTTRSKGGGIFSPIKNSTEDDSIRKSTDASTPSRSLRREKSREVLKMSELEEGSIIIPCFLPQFGTTVITPKSANPESIETPTWRSVDIAASFEKSIGHINSSPSDENRDESSLKIEKEKSKGFSIIEHKEDEMEILTNNSSSEEDTSDEAYCKYHFCRELIERNQMGNKMHKMDIPDDHTKLSEEFYKVANELYVKRKKKKIQFQSVDISAKLEEEFQKLKARYLHSPQYLERTWKQEDEEKYLTIGSPRAYPSNRLKRSHSACSLTGRKNAIGRWLDDCPSSEEKEDHFDISESELTSFERETGRVLLKTKRPKRGKKKRSESYSFPQKVERVEPSMPTCYWEKFNPVVPSIIDPALGRERLVVRLRRILVDSTSSMERQSTENILGSHSHTHPCSKESTVPPTVTNSPGNQSEPLRLESIQHVSQQRISVSEHSDDYQVKSKVRKTTELQSSMVITPFISQ